MTAKLVEDLFLADDLEAVSPLSAEMIRDAESHEEVEEVRAKLLDLFRMLGDCDNRP